MSRFTDRHDVLVSICDLALHETAASRTPCTFALAIVTTPRSVILVKNSRDRRWELPGGFIDMDESPHCCAIREVREETGIEILQLTAVAVAVVAPPVSNRRKELEVGMIFVGHSSHALQKPRFDSEISAAGRFRFDRLPAALGSIDRALLAQFGGRRRP